MADPGQMNATFMYTDTWGIYQGTVDNLTDGDSSTALDFRTSGDRTRKGDYIGWDLGKETAKFEQVIKAGVRQIAILADDAGNVGGANYTKTLTDMTAWLKEMQKHILI